MMITITRKYAETPQNENIYIAKGLLENSTIIYFQNGLGQELSESTDQLCLVKGLYMLTLASSYNNWWAVGSRITIKSEEGFIILDTVLNSYTNRRIKLNCKDHVTKASSWKYSDTYQNNWNSITYNDEDWINGQQGLLQDMALNTITRYYRITLNPSDSISLFSAFRLSVYFQYGIVIYVNAQEIFRYNMPSGVITSATQASKFEPEPTLKSLYYPTDVFKSSSLAVIAVELHLQYNHELYEDPFYLLFSVLPSEQDDTYHHCNLITSTDYAPMENFIYRLTDDDLRTSVSMTPSTSVTFTMDSSYFIVNQYSITLVNPSQSSLKAWKFEGKSEEEWITLDTRESPFYFYQSSTFSIDLPNQNTPYQAYRITFISITSSDFVSISDIQLRIQQPQVTDVYLRYPLTSYSLFHLQEHIIISPVIPGFSNFVIAPALPEGLQFSSLAGTISGSLTVSTPTATQLFTIQGQLNNSPYYKTTLLIRITPCDNNDILFQITMHSLGQSLPSSWSLQLNEDTIVSNHGINTLYQSSYTQKVCLTKQIYSLVLSSSYHQPWPEGTYISLSVTILSNLIRLGGITLTSSSSLSIPLHLFYYSDSSKLNWYYYPLNDIPSDWTSAESSSSWDSYSSSPTLAQSVWLFRNTIHVTTLEPYALLEVRVYCRAGLLLTINGHEIHRYSIPAEPLTSSMVAIDKSPNPFWHILTFKLSQCYFHIGSNTIAIAAINPSAESRKVDFKAIIVPLYHTALMSRQFSDDSMNDSLVISDSTHRGDHSSSLLFDSDFTTYFSSSISSSSTPHVLLTYQHGRYDVYNQYCIRSSLTSSSYDPFSWVFESSTDNLQWSPLHTVISTQFKRGEKKCAFFSLSNAPYYRLRITSNRNNQANIVNIAELGLFYNHTDLLIIPELTMSVTSFTLFVNCSFTTPYTINNDLFSRFSVQPSLPTGLYIDTITGYLFGTPVASLPPTQFTLTSQTTAGNMRSCEFQLSVISCENESHTHTLVQVKVDDFASTEDQNHIELMISNRNTIVVHNVIVGEHEYQHSSDITSFHQYYCIPSDLYQIQFHYLIRSSSSPTYFITVSNLIQPYSGTFAKNLTSLTLTLDSTKFIHPELTSWHYFIDNSIPAPNWYQTDLSSSWPQAKPGSFPSQTTLTSYYCTTFHAYYSFEASGFTVGVYTRGGYVMYLNGIEINRVRLPEGTITHHTPCLQASETASYILFTGSTQFLPLSTSSSPVEGDHNNDNNRLCIEIHRLTSVNEDNDFKVYMEYIANHSDRIIDGQCWGSVEGYEEPWYEYTENAFDKNPKTKYFGMSDCTDVMIRWTYNNDRKEFINRLRFYAGNMMNRKPQKLRLEGQDASLSWHKLFEIDNLIWNINTYGEWKEWFIPNSIAYRAYQVVANGCRSEGIEIAEIILYADRVTVDCPAVGDYPAANEGEESHGPCPEYLTGYSVRKCENGEFSEIDYSNCIPTPPTDFYYNPSHITTYTYSYISISPVVTFYVEVFSIKPVPPAGLMFNVTSGRLFGKPYETSSSSHFIVTAKNSKGKSQTSIEINIKDGCPDISDFPATAVGETAIYYCHNNYWLYGTIERTCEDRDGIAQWSAPRGYCKSNLLLIILICLIVIIGFAFIGMWCLSSSVSRQMNVYQLPNGEYELEEINGDISPTSTDETGETAASRVRIRPAMKLVGRPVFLYIPRYFHKSKREYKKQYHELHKTTRHYV